MKLLAAFKSHAKLHLPPSFSFWRSTQAVLIISQPSTSYSRTSQYQHQRRHCSQCLFSSHNVSVKVDIIVFHSSRSSTPLRSLKPAQVAFPYVWYPLCMPCRCSYLRTLRTHLHVAYAIQYHVPLNRTYVKIPLIVPPLLMPLSTSIICNRRRELHQIGQPQVVSSFMFSLHLAPPSSTYPALIYTVILP